MQRPPAIRPDGSAVTDDIPCPLCEYNLRGITEPRCPECGYKFDWPDLLDPHRRLHAYLYEHHPQRRLWAFFRTLFGGLRPYRFWRSLHPAQPVRPGRLTEYWLLQLAVPVLLSLLILGSAVGGLARRNLAERRWWRSAITNAAHEDMVKSFVARYGSFESYLDSAYPITPWRLIQSLGTRREVLPEMLLLLPAILLAWPVVTLAALFIFEASRRRVKIRRIHILRCVVYSGDVVWWIGLGAMVLAPVMAYFFMSSPQQWRVAYVSVQLAIIAVALVGQVLFTIRLHAAYRRYLRFPHAGPVVASSQLIAWLVALNAALAASGF